MKKSRENKNGTDPQSIWVQMSKGSLVIEAEIDGNPVEANWPTREEMRQIVQNTLANSVGDTLPGRCNLGELNTAPTRPNVSMAERVQSVPDPWQNTVGDLWSNNNVRTETSRGNSQESGHKNHGFRLVFENDFNLTKFHGSQDPENKIPYLKWAKH